MSAGRIERRLAAILALDVTGYSHLMGGDEIGTLRALKAHRRDRIDPSIARHNGRIASIAGDGLMAEFASVVDAVAAAVTVQRAMQDANAAIAPERRIVLRIGINVGDIIIDGGGIFGDGVNVAARLEALSEPGGICISRSAYEQVRDRLGLPFSDLGEQSVKNITRSIGVFALTPQDIATLRDDPLTAAAVSRRKRPALGAALRAGAVACLVAGALAAGWRLGMPAPTAAPAVARLAPPVVQDRRGSIAVLPFEAAGSGPDGLARAVAERLASDRGWPVTAPAIAARYVGKVQDARGIGREQNIHFVLTGTTRMQDGHLRVSAVLRETQEGREVWTQQFDQPASDGQAAVLAAMIAADINQVMIDVEAARARREHPGSLDAADLYFAALESTLIPLTRTNLAARIALLDQALAADPAHVPALGLMARLRALLVLNDWSAERAADLAAAQKAADRLLEANPRDVYQIRTKAYVLRAQGQLDQAMTLHRRALEIDPSIADSHREIGVILQAQGRHAEALASFTAARARSEGDFILDTQTASALLANGRFAEAIQVARIALAENPGGGIDTPWLTLIAAYGMLGQSDAKSADAAQAELARYFASAQPIRSLAEVRQDRGLAALPNLLGGLRGAGLPEE